VKKILLVTVALLAAASWFLIMRDSDTVTSPVGKKHEAVTGSNKKIGEGSKGVSRGRPKASLKSPGAVLSTDCLKKEVTTACKKTKGGKKSTSPTPLSRKSGSLEEGSYSRLPE